MSKIMEVDEFAGLILEFTNNTKRDVITEVNEVGDNFSMSVNVDEEFMKMFEDKYSDYDFEPSLNAFFVSAIESIVDDGKDSED